MLSKKDIGNLVSDISRIYNNGLCIASQAKCYFSNLLQDDISANCYKCCNGELIKVGRFIYCTYQDAKGQHVLR